MLTIEEIEMIAKNNPNFVRKMTKSEMTQAFKRSDSKFASSIFG